MKLFGNLFAVTSVARFLAAGSGVEPCHPEMAELNGASVLFLTHSQLPKMGQNAVLLCRMTSKIFEDGAVYDARLDWFEVLHHDTGFELKRTH